MLSLQSLNCYVIRYLLDDEVDLGCVYQVGNDGWRLRCCAGEQSLALVSQLFRMLISLSIISIFSAVLSLMNRNVFLDSVLKVCCVSVADNAGKYY